MTTAEIVALSVVAMENSQEFPGCTARSVSYWIELLAAPAVVVYALAAWPANTASPSRIAFPETLTRGTNSSEPSADTAIVKDFKAETFCGTVNDELTLAVPILSIAWKAPVALNWVSDLLITIAIFYSLGPQFERTYCS